MISTTDKNQQLQTQLIMREQLYKSLAAEAKRQKILLGRLEQQLVYQGILVNEKKAHIRSPVEKHLHTREVLKHYRQSVKDQRDQDQRNHEHQAHQLQAKVRQLNQMLSIKQTDLTHLNTANAELTAEVRHARKALNDSERQSRVADTKLSAVNEQYQAAAHQIVELTIARDQPLRDKDDIGERLGLIEKALKASEIELGTAKTELSVKNQLLGSLGFHATTHDDWMITPYRCTGIRYRRRGA